MKNEILILIQCDLINARMIDKLNKMEIEASVYRLRISTAILGLLGLRQDERTDKLYEQYFSILENHSRYKLSKKGLDKASLEIYDKLNRIIEDQKSNKID